MTTDAAPVELREVEVLDGSPRTLVVRAAVHGPPGLPGTVVVKVHLEYAPWSTHVREPAALEVLTALGGGLAPRLIAVAAHPPLVVLEDLGADRRDLAALLLGDDPAAADETLMAWAATMARLHASTAGRDELVTEALARNAARLGCPPPPTDDMPGALERAADALATHLPLLGVEPSADALGNVRHLAGLLGGDAAARALSPADACPDNNAVTETGMVLLDFEGAAARHVAWDAAYLRVPWPSCWCSWRLPDALAERALARWRSDLAETVPYIGTTGLDADLEIAEAGWAAISTGWFLERAVHLEGGVAAEPLAQQLTPSRRAALSHRLARVGRSTDPRLGPWRDLVVETLAAARSTWGEVPLELAPAFRAR
jgi:hypothetical protein